MQTNRDSHGPSIQDFLLLNLWSLHPQQASSPTLFLTQLRDSEYTKIALHEDLTTKIEVHPPSQFQQCFLRNPKIDKLDLHRKQQQMTFLTLCFKAGT